MFRKRKKLCPNCKTGKETYELDRHSEYCPYIGAYSKNKCRYYVPLKQEKKGIMKLVEKIQRH